MSPWGVFAHFLFGLATMIFGLILRFDREGRHRSHYAQYYDKRWAFHFRNRAFGLIPYGMVAILWAIALAVNELAGQWLFVATALGILGLLVGFIGLVVTYRPPDWLKPQWLREEERRGEWQQQT